MTRTDSELNKWIYEADSTPAANTMKMKDGWQFIGCHDNPLHNQTTFMTDTELVQYMNYHNLFYKEQLEPKKSRDTRGRRQPDLFEVMRDYAN